MGPGTSPENYIVRGMNESYNYYVSQNQIFDLENNLPIQAVSGNSLSQYGEFRRENNQRKIFLNETRHLSIDKANVLCFPTSRMDHLLWKNINDLGEQPNIIDDSTNIKQYFQIYNGQSLFHYFVQNSEVIEVMHNKYMNLKDNNILRPQDKFMPLVLLNPDYNGKTALELAVDL